MACVLFAIIHNIPGNPEGFRAHVALITGRASKDFQEFANDVGGQARLLASTLRHVVFVLGLRPSSPVSSVSSRRSASAQIDGFCCWSRALRSTCFLCVVLYVYDRFALPIAIVLAFFAGRTLSRHWDDRRWPRTAARAGAVVILAYGLTRAIGWTSRCPTTRATRQRNG